MYVPDGRSDHELRRCYMGKIVSSWIFFDPPGHGILCFGGVAVVEGFQTIRSSLGLRVVELSFLKEGAHISKEMVRAWPASVARDR